MFLNSRPVYVDATAARESPHMPSGTRLAQGGPEEPVQPIQIGTGAFSLANPDLLPQGENSESGVAATVEEGADGGQV